MNFFTPYLVTGTKGYIANALFEAAKHDTLFSLHILPLPPFRLVPFLCSLLRSLFLFTQHLMDQQLRESNNLGNFVDQLFRFWAAVIVSRRVYIYICRSSRGETNCEVAFETRI